MSNHKYIENELNKRNHTHNTIKYILSNYNCELISENDITPNCVDYDEYQFTRYEEYEYIIKYLTNNSYYIVHAEYRKIYYDEYEPTYSNFTVRPYDYTDYIDYIDNDYIDNIDRNYNTHNNCSCVDCLVLSLSVHNIS
jgi:hypothetical protein